MQAFCIYTIFSHLTSLIFHCELIWSRKNYNSKIETYMTNPNFLSVLALTYVHAVSILGLWWHLNMMNMKPI